MVLVQVDPPLVLTCHWTVGVGEPVAAADRSATLPACTERFEGCCVMDGATGATTVKVAAWDVIELDPCVKITRYWLPLSLRFTLVLKL